MLTEQRYRSRPLNLVKVHAVNWTALYDDIKNGLMLICFKVRSIKCHTKLWSFYQTSALSNLCGSTRECVHLVKRIHFRSRDNDGGRTSWSAVVENTMLHADFTRQDDCHIIRTKPVSSTPGVIRLREYERPTSGLSKVIVWRAATAVNAYI